jgi:DNA-binding CsgD family transcriptional regulator
VTAGRLDEARDVLAETRSVVESTADARASFTLKVAQSALEYADDRFGESLELIVAAYRDGIFAGDDQRLRLAHMWHGELLSGADQYDAAMGIASDGLAAAQRDHQGWAFQMFETWHGRILLRAGQISEAAALLEARYALEDGTHAAAVLDAAGLVAHTRLAIHTGDTREARRVDDIAQVMLEQGTPAVRRHAGWLLAALAMSRDDAQGARGRLRAIAVRPRFPIDIADDILLARVALATQDDELARLALTQTQARVELNLGIVSLAAAAAHVRGLLEPSPAQLAEAVQLFERVPRPLELATALEDLGAELTATDRESAIDALGRALALFTELGATWDARRVRSRLRELGVRRRLVAAEPETNGWAAMTAAELAVARLVAEGLTNKEVADQLFVSPHTVSSHLRHVFSKLGITSRVELARVARDYEIA